MFNCLMSYCPSKNYIGAMRGQFNRDLGRHLLDLAFLWRILPLFLQAIIFFDYFYTSFTLKTKMLHMDNFKKIYHLILGFDWQLQIQARCTYDPNGSLCISTPFSSSRHSFECTHAAKPSMNCLTSKKLSLPPLDDVVLPKTTSKTIFKNNPFLNLINFLRSYKLNLMR